MSQRFYSDHANQFQNFSPKRSEKSIQTTDKVHPAKYIRNGNIYNHALLMYERQLERAMKESRQILQRQMNKDGNLEYGSDGCRFSFAPDGSVTEVRINLSQVKSTKEENGEIIVEFNRRVM